MENVPTRKDMRLQSWDYASEGWYYITICTLNHKHHFGEVKGNKMVLNNLGKTAEQLWTNIPSIYRVNLDEYVVMPNHVHGILIYEDAGTKPVGSIISAYKNSVSRWSKQSGINHFAWQRGYFDHIIRNDRSLTRIREYIHNNALAWELEKGDPENIGDLK